MTQERVRIGTDGRISSAGSEATPRIATQFGEYDTHEGPEGMFLFTPANRGGEPRGQLLMMGELVARMTVVEIVNLVTTTNWRGELHIAARGGRRIFDIDQGVLKHARTDFESERLGELLVHSDRISRHDLVRLLAQKPSDRRLGQQLVEAGLIDQPTLFAQLQRQAETIFYAGLLEQEGVYWFIAQGDTAPPPIMTMHLPIHALLMEGVQRIDEMTLYRERMPHNRLFPFVAPENRKATNDPVAAAVLQLCDGKHNLDAIARKTSLGEFPTLKAVYGLLRSQKAQLLSGPTADAKLTERLIRHFNDLMRDIFLAVGTYGRMEGTQRTISSWLAASPHESVLGAHVDVDGTLDSKAVHTRLEQSSHDDPMGALHHALHELSAFALFTAAHHLPRRDEQALTRDIHHRLKQLKL